MHAQLLNSHFAQLVSAWKKSKYNRYSDYDKQEYHDNLASLFEKIKNTDFEKLSGFEKEEIKQILFFFTVSLEFLDNSTINSVPFELIECLKYAMEEWIDDYDKYIIVTSYNDFSFDPSLVINKVYSIIESKYKIQFSKKLVQISLPKHLSRDYLTNSVLYHELGHFVDSILEIYDAIFLSISNQIRSSKTSKKDKDDILKYFPYMLSPPTLWSLKEIEFMFKMHIKEYFADLFAAQYVSKSACNHLVYIAPNAPISSTHPSTQNRINIVDEFLGDYAEYGCVVKTFISETLKKTRKEIKLRYASIASDDIISLIPCEISQSEQLHFLYNLGWNIWLYRTSEFKDKNNMNEHLKQGQIYQIINNLIEKSINNYMIVKSWNYSKGCI